MRAPIWLVHGVNSSLGYDYDFDPDLLPTARVFCALRPIASCQRGYCGVPFRAAGIHWRTGTRKGDFSWAATDLNRECSFQGAGLVDLVRAIESA